MKVSLKFREEQRPLLRAKVPISILGLPFLSGVAAGEARELRLDVATAFESGPALRLSYCPNDPWNPFSLALKTGTAALGSPSAAPITMSAEFNLLGRAGPAFRVLFKPRLGDFALKKAATSSPPSDPVVVWRIPSADPDENGCGGGGGGVPQENGIHRPETRKPNGFVRNGGGVGGGGGINALLAGTELSASSTLPVGSHAAVKFRWGVRIPAELHTALDSFGRDRTAGTPLLKLPLLVMSKISVEHAAKGKKPGPGASKDVDHVTEACMAVKRQLEALQAESGLLRRTVEELRAEMGGGKVAAGGVRETAVLTRNGTRPAAAAVVKRERRSEEKPMEISSKIPSDDLNEELKKALMGATGAGK